MHQQLNFRKRTVPKPSPKGMCPQLPRRGEGGVKHQQTPSHLPSEILLLQRRQHLNQLGKEAKAPMTSSCLLLQDLLTLALLPPHVLADRTAEAHRACSSIMLRSSLPGVCLLPLNETAVPQTAVHRARVSLRLRTFRRRAHLDCPQLSRQLEEARVNGLLHLQVDNAP